MSEKKLFLSVIIPCYNEEANLKRGVLERVNSYLSEQSYSWEVIVSDDGSTDKSKNLIKEQIKDWKKFRLLENPHGGKPSALFYGIKSATGKYVLITDMDQSTPIKELKKLLPFVKQGYDVVVGSRGMQRKNFPFYRKLGAVVFIGLRKALVLREIDDTQCGFKLFKRDLVDKTFPKLEFFRKDRKVKGWKVTSWDVELLHILKKWGSKIKEVRVAWNDQDKSGSKGGTLKRYVRESQEMFFQILRVKYNDIRGLYD